MKLQRILLLLGTSILLASLGISGCTTNTLDFEADTQTPTITSPTTATQRRPDVPYVPTPQPVMDAMLQLAQAKSHSSEQIFL